MAKYQRQYQVGAEYRVQGSAKRTRRLKLIGRAKISGKEVLMFRPVRKARKARKRRRH